MKILISTFDYRPRRGGVATCGYELAAALSRCDNTEVRVLAPAIAGGEEFDRAQTFSTRRVELPSSATGALIPLTHATLDEIKIWRPDAVLNLLWHPNAISTRIARALARKDERPATFTIAHAVELMESERNFKKKLRKALSPIKESTLRSSTGLFAVSRFTASLLENQCSVPRRLIHVVPNGVRTEVFYPKPPSPALVESLDLQGKTVFLTLCRLLPHKGIDIALEALKRVIAKHPNVIYLIGGTGTDRSRLDTLVTRLGLNQHVHFLGDLEENELIEYYNLTDCFILLSREEPTLPQVEGFGIVFLEASACAKPVIAGRSGGTSDAVEEGVSGWLVDPQNPDAVARVMMDVIENPDRARGLGKLGLERVRSRFTWDHSARSIRSTIGKSSLNKLPTQKKICFYSIATEMGGAERSLLDLVIRLKQSSNGKYTPLVLLPKTTGPLVDQLKENRISYEVLPMPAGMLKISRHGSEKIWAQLSREIFHLIYYSTQLRKWFKKNEPDFIHCTGIKCHILAFLATFGSSRKVIWHFRDIISSRWLRTFFENGIRHGGVHAIANSEATSRSLVHGKDENIKVIYNGLDPGRYRIVRSDYLRTKLGIDSSTKIIGILGVLARWKGQVEFIQMARELVQLGYPVAFVIVGDMIYDTDGDSGYKDSLSRMIRDLGLHKQVFMTGYESDPVQVLNSIDILVHASIRPEPFGRVILEAMALEVPVVASAAGGVLELISHGQNGLLFRPGNISEMISCVRQVLDHPEDAKLHAKHAKEKFEASFTIDRHVSQVISCYDKWTEVNGP